MTGKYVVIKKKIVHGFEHKERARGTGGKKSWTERISLERGKLYGYSIHVISKRGPGTSANVSVADEVITINGQTGYEHETGKGGNYSAQVHATYLMLEEAAEDISVLNSGLSGVMKVASIANDTAAFTAALNSINSNLRGETNFVVSMLENGSFESGTTAHWNHRSTNWGVRNDAEAAYRGSWRLVANDVNSAVDTPSVYQDVTDIPVGTPLQFSARVKSSRIGRSVTMTLWELGLGGVDASFVVNEEWQELSVTRTKQQDDTVVRAEIYWHDHEEADIHIDACRLVYA